jgi:hypothetical protein
MKEKDIYRVCPCCGFQKGFPYPPYFDEEIGWVADVECLNLKCGHKWKEVIDIDDDEEE